MSTTLSLDEYLKASYHERENSYKMVEVLRRFPPIRYIQEPVQWGVFAWALQTSKIRWIHGNTMVNLGFGPQTPGDVVRDYLDWKFPRRLRACGTQTRNIFTHKSTPLYLRPGVLKDGVYIDIQAAYFSIVNLFGWDVDYFPGKWFVPGTTCEDFPMPDHKPARAMLVSMGLSHTGTRWTGDHFEHYQTGNRHRNYGLWTFVQDILHAIAGYAERLGALYIHTDGYILPVGQSDILQDYIASWGLHSREKARGESLVLGFGNYVVGSNKTKRLRPIAGHKYRYIRDVPERWLRGQLTRFLPTS
jgi:hypothetical protein